MMHALKELEQRALVLIAEWAVSMMTTRTVVRWVRENRVRITARMGGDLTSGPTPQGPPIVLEGPNYQHDKRGPNPPEAVVGGCSGSFTS